MRLDKPTGDPPVNYLESAMPDQRTDAEVADLRIAKMLGWKALLFRDTERKRQLWGVPSSTPHASFRKPVPDFFGDASAAEQVVVAMIDRGFHYECHGWRTATGEYHWMIRFFRNTIPVGQADGFGTSAAPFICRAALDAMGESDG